MLNNVQWAMRGMCCNWACVALCKPNSDSKSNLVLNDHSKPHILPVFVKPYISTSVSNFCVSSTLSKSNDAIVLKNPSFTSYSFESGSVANSVSPRSFRKPKSFISVSPTNRINFSYSIQNLLVRFLQDLSYLSPLHLKSSKHFSHSSTLACQSIFSLSSAFVFQTFELPFQSNATTLLFTTIRSRSWTICMYLLTSDLVSIY